MQPLFYNRVVHIGVGDDAYGVTTSDAVYMYAYNASDQRVTKSIDADADGTPETLQGFVYDGVNLALVVDAGDAPVQRYLMGADHAGVAPKGTHQNEIFAEETVSTGPGGPNVTRWALTDNQGTVRKVHSPAPRSSLTLPPVLGLHYPCFLLLAPNIYVSTPPILRRAVKK
jgi:hypothetical protein